MKAKAYDILRRLLHDGAKYFAPTEITYYTPSMSPFSPAYPTVDYINAAENLESGLITIHIADCGWIDVLDIPENEQAVNLLIQTIQAR